VTIALLGKWFGRTDAIVSTTVAHLEKIEAAVETAQAVNTQEHIALAVRIDAHPVHTIVAAHGERIARIEAEIHTPRPKP